MCERPSLLFLFGGWVGWLVGWLVGFVLFLIFFLFHDFQVPSATRGPLTTRETDGYRETDRQAGRQTDRQRKQNRPGARQMDMDKHENFSLHFQFTSGVGVWRCTHGGRAEEIWRQLKTGSWHPSTESVVAVRNWAHISVRGSN